MQYKEHKHHNFRGLVHSGEYENLGNEFHLPNGVTINYGYDSVDLTDGRSIVDGEYWTLNNVRLYKIKGREDLGICKVISIALGGLNVQCIATSEVHTVYTSCLDGNADIWQEDDEIVTRNIRFTPIISLSQWYAKQFNHNEQATVPEEKAMSKSKFGKLVENRVLVGGVNVEDMDKTQMFHTIRDLENSKKELQSIGVKSTAIDAQIVEIDNAIRVIVELLDAE